MSLQRRKNEYVEDMARIFKLLGSPSKLKLLNFISFCPRTVEDCAIKFNQSVQNVSLHLIALAKANILEVVQVKNFRYYSLSSHPVVMVISKVLHADPRTLLPAEKIWDLSLGELMEGIERNRIVLVDLRDFEESAYLPIEGAVHFDGKIPQLIDFLKSRPRKVLYVLLCKGRMCERLAESVEAACSAGLNVQGLPLSAFELRELGHHLH
jgi:DNA-binding transcriptional ArsR family regulator